MRPENDEPSAYVNSPNERSTRPVSKMVIKTRGANAQKPVGGKRLIDAEELGKILENGRYFKANCRQFWEDTALTQIYLGMSAITELDRFLRTHNTHEIKEDDSMIPEIGGFLIGKIHVVSPETEYEVVVEEFIPIRPERSNTFQIEFSTESLVNDLGDIQDKYPQYALLGWFHTHPGHGLFLSAPDMRIHDGFFKEKHQFAMEIDSLSPDLDTAFFTRKTSGDTNNVQSSEDVEYTWLQWTEIEKTSRRKD